MKLKPTFNKLPLIALLFLGLVCSPLAVNADNGNRGWSGHHRQDHGKPHHKTDQRSDYRDYDHRYIHGNRDSCRTGNKHGHKTGHHKHWSHGYDSHNTPLRHHYREGHQNDQVYFIPESYFGSLAVLFYN